MSWLNPVHQASGRTTLWNSWPVMLCGKVVRPDGRYPDWRRTGKRVDCPGCLKRMR